MAPTGSKPDRRKSGASKPLRASIKVKMTSSTSGYWYSDARHALPVEKGARDHTIPGMVSFFWEKEGRDWEPGFNLIQHPGNRAQPFLHPAYKVVMRDWPKIAKRVFPG